MSEARDGMPVPRKPFDGRMFVTMEKARRLRGACIAMLVAAWLAVSAAFGLHPEPLGVRAGDSLPPDIEKPAVGDESRGPHDCLACRAHRPLVCAPSPAELVSPRLAAVRELVLASSPLLTFEPPSPDGRAPPESA